MNTPLRWRIHNIQCVNKSSQGLSDKTGLDRVFLGCVPISADGLVEHRKEFPIGLFDNVKIKRFDPPRPFVSFQIHNDRSELGDFYICLALFTGAAASKSMQQVYKVIDTIIKNKRAELQSPGQKPIESLSTNKIWPLVKAAVFTHMETRFSKEENTILFPIQEVTIQIPSSNHSWNDQKTSPVSEVEFRNADGRYKLQYDWELI